MLNISTTVRSKGGNGDFKTPIPRKGNAFLSECRNCLNCAFIGLQNRNLISRCPRSFCP